MLVAHVVEHLADPNQALRELYHVLKPGGILICAITRRSAFGAYIQLVWRTHQVDIPAARHWLHGCGLCTVRAVPFDK